ncbi:hypothetical protein LSH36_512g02037 [Paralvinella palmiformis]|uniref:DNA alkylation repair protein n=1 Tax=Paralvinella palmiformis TaxID=53620 RepID=A0AAD9J8M4_9ANNE|nr:hypothetical protein LSH36_512g02037 [Paralvinella palmiformis]
MPKHQRRSSPRSTSKLRVQTSYSRVTTKDTTKMQSKGIGVAAKVVDDLERLLVKACNPADAQPMKKYMRNQFEYFGVKTPKRKEIMKQVFHTMTDPSSGEVLSVAKLLWTRDQRELHYCAVDILIKYKSLLASNAQICAQSANVVRHLLTEKSWWDTVDLLASNVVGHMASTQPSHMKPLLDKWITTDNMWLRRTAILHQLKYKGNTDEMTLFRYCMKCSDEDEFFIRKAIGWALREYHKTNPGAVRDFVAEHKNRLAPLSVKEALKHD